MDPRVIVFILVGVLAIGAAWAVVIYRVGRFHLMPGETGRQIRNLLFGLAVAVAIPFLAVQLPAELVAVGAVVATIALLLYGRRSRASVEQVMSGRSAEDRAESERRMAFLRSRQGRTLLLATIVSMVLWAVAGSIIAAR